MEWRLWINTFKVCCNTIFVVASLKGWLQSITGLCKKAPAWVWRALQKPASSIEADINVGRVNFKTYRFIIKFHVKHLFRSTGFLTLVYRPSQWDQKFHAPLKSLKVKVFSPLNFCLATPLPSLGSDASSQWQLSPCSLYPFLIYSEVGSFLLAYLYSAPWENYRSAILQHFDLFWPLVKLNQGVQPWTNQINVYISSWTSGPNITNIKHWACNKCFQW